MSIKRLVTAGLILLLACKPPSASDQMNSVISWVATAAMAGEAWLRGGALDKYTRQTLELSHDTMRQIGGDLLKSLPAGIDSAALDSTLTRTSGHVAQMARLVDQKDSPDLRAQLDSLYAEEKLVKQFADSIEAREQ